MIAQAINNKNFSEAITLLNSGEKLQKNINQYALNQIFDTLFREKQFEILNHFIKDKTIVNDIYEYDNFDKSIFVSLVRNLPSDDDSVVFLKEFISKFENCNDQIQNTTLLKYFIEKEVSLSFIEVLVESGCDANFISNSEENYLHQIVKHRFNNEKTALDYLRFFIYLGLDTNAQNIVRETPLIVAINNNRNCFVEMLLQNGANPNEVNQKGNSAFYYAIAHKFDYQLYKLLSQYDSAQFDVLNSNKESFFFTYVRGLQSVSGSTTEFLTTLLADGAHLYLPNSWYSEDKTALDIIAEKSSDILQVVLDSGKVEINFQDNAGNTLLHKVCAYNVNYSQDAAKETYKKVKLLLENGADATIVNDQDKTAIMLAMEDNLKVKTVELLLKK